MYLGSLQIGWITSDWYADTPIPYKGDKNRRRRDNKKKDKRTNGLPTSEEGKCKKEIKEDSSGHSVTSTIKEDNINTKENVNSRMSGGSVNLTPIQENEDSMRTKEKSSRNTSRKFKQKKNSQNTSNDTQIRNNSNGQRENTTEKQVGMERENGEREQAEELATPSTLYTQESRERERTTVAGSGNHLQEQKDDIEEKLVTPSTLYTQETSTTALYTSQNSHDSMSTILEMYKNG